MRHDVDVGASAASLLALGITVSQAAQNSPRALGVTHSERARQRPAIVQTEPV